MTDRYRVVRPVLMYSFSFEVVQAVGPWRLTPRDAVEASGEAWALGLHPLVKAIVLGRVNDNPTTWRGFAGAYIERSPWPPLPSGWSVWREFFTLSRRIWP